MFFESPDRTTFRISSTVSGLVRFMRWNISSNVVWKSFCIPLYMDGFVHTSDRESWEVSSCSRVLRVVLVMEVLPFLFRARSRRLLYGRSRSWISRMKFG